MFHNRRAVRFIFIASVAIIGLGSLEAYSIEPYSVKSIYFMPTDSIDKSDWLNLDEIMKNIQNTYRNEMNRHGFPNQTFRLETDQKGKVVVHKVEGDHDRGHYAGNTVSVLIQELERKGYNDIHTVYSIVMAGMDTVQNGAGGTSESRPWGAWFGNGNSQYSGYSISTEKERGRVKQIIQHELGHAFGLWHIVSDEQDDYIMGRFGWGNKLAFHEARWLSKNHYFNKLWHHNFGPSTIHFNGSEVFEDNKIRFTATISDRDNDGIFQTYAWVNFNIIGWNFHDEKNSIVVVDFTDIDRKHLIQSNQITFQSMDEHGNWMIDFPQSYTLPEPEPEAEPEEVIYENYIKNGTQSWNFEEHAKGWKIANGKWSVDNGLYKVSRGGVAEHSLVGQSDWENYTIDAKVRIDDVHWAGIVFRAKSEMEYYVYYLNTLDQRNQLFKHSAGAWDNREEIAWTFTVGGIRLENNVWYNVTVEVFKDKFICYINGKKQIEKLDDSYETGKVGVWAWDTTASFDDFTVTKKEIEEDMKSSLNVDPIEKLTTLWGHIKQLD